MVKHTRMEENKRVYNAEYDTDEYEDLTCECHHVARSKELNGSRRKPFFCIHCKTVFKDKNKLNLHRIEGCFAVTNDGRKTVLKIYPVFGKGQRGEIEDILIKHGYMNPRKKPSRAKRKKSTVALRDTDTSNEVEVEMEAADDRLRTIRPQKLKGRGMLSSAPESREKHSTDTHGEIQVPLAHHKQVECNPESGNFAVVEQGQMQVQMQLTRSQVEVQAWDIAKSLFPDASEVKCPEEVPCPGLWYLMQYKLLPINFPDVKHSSFLQAFSDFIEKGHIEPGLRSSYGTWYMERETDADEKEQNAVKLTMSRFKLNGGHPDLEARNKERTALQKYLQYLQELSQYESQKTAAEADLRSKREKYVRDRMDEVDAIEHVALWHWSPLLHLLKHDNIAGVPPRPWSHSDAEQRKIAQAITLHRNLNVKDPPHCPTIVRMFKLYMYCFDKARVLSDPVAGLLRETMLQLPPNECAAAPVLRHFKIAAESVLNEGWLLFANSPTYPESQAKVFEDIDSLLHGPEAEREAVVEKVQNFLKIVRQRAAGDMAQLHPNGFSVLWCGGDDISRADAQEKFMHCLKSREDLDIGWVSFPSGHLDFNCSAVVQAREAVVRAINELHQQRVISDRLRLMTANPHFQTNIPDNHDKFQALVQTCVGTSLKEDAHVSANGSESGKEVLEDVSEMGRTLDYFRGSGKLGQSSVTLQSSHNANGTGAVRHDVGRSKNSRDVVDEPSRDHFKSSPDLNLDPSSADPNCDTIHYHRQLTAHGKALQMNPVVLTTKLTSLGFEVENPVAYPVTTFVGSHRADAQHSPITSPFPIRSPILQSNTFTASLNPTQLSRKCSTSSAPASVLMHQSMDSHSRGGQALFNTQVSFSSTFTARASNGSHRRSSSPSLRVAGVDGDGEH